MLFGCYRDVDTVQSILFLISEEWAKHGKKFSINCIFSSE